MYIQFTRIPIHYIIARQSSTRMYFTMTMVNGLPPSKSSPAGQAAISRRHCDLVRKEIYALRNAHKTPVVRRTPLDRVFQELDLRWAEMTPEEKTTANTKELALRLMEHFFSETSSGNHSTTVPRTDPPPVLRRIPGPRR